MQFLAEYGLFLAKAITIVAAILIATGGVISLAMRQKKSAEKQLDITHLNSQYEEMETAISSAVLTEVGLKQKAKADKKKAKAEAKAEKKAGKLERKSADSSEAPQKKRLFVIDFDGDIKASDVETMRQEISALLTLATKEDEVLVRYMMACVAHKIIAAPFAIIGSIGVLAQIPNLNRLLKKHDVDFEQLYAGEYKRTLTLFGENTEKGRSKMQEELEETHTLFKNFVKSQRPMLDIDSVATGEHWLGSRALELGLVDELKTSDDYLMSQRNDAELVLIEYSEKKTILDKLSHLMTMKWSQGSKMTRDIETPMLM
jgi:serine protease SohB